MDVNMKSGRQGAVHYQEDGGMSYGQRRQSRGVYTEVSTAMYTVAYG